VWQRISGHLVSQWSIVMRQGRRRWSWGGICVDEAEPHRRGSSSARQLSELSTSLERVRYSSLTWRRCVRCVAAMCAVCRGAELSILPSLSTPTNWSLPSHNSPDSAHRHRLANVARGTLVHRRSASLDVVGLSRSVRSKRLIC
jgi:hypothetical protein